MTGLIGEYDKYPVIFIGRHLFSLQMFDVGVYIQIA